MEKVYIPKNVGDAVVELDKILNQEARNDFVDLGEDDIYRYHHKFGRFIRTEWDLWTGSRLSKWFRSVGIINPVEMSNIITESYRRHVNGEPIEVVGQIKGHQEV